MLLVEYRYDTGEVQLYPSGEHDSANCSTVILGKIAAWSIKIFLRPTYFGPEFRAVPRLGIRGYGRT